MKATVRADRFPRRRRPVYPTMDECPRGQSVLLLREECGHNIQYVDPCVVIMALAAGIEPPRRMVLVGKAVFTRLPVSKARSKYTGVAS